MQIEFGDEVSVDEIVLVSTLRRDTDDGFQAEGFPIDFRIIAGSSDDESGSLLTSYTEADCLLPRLTPVIVVRCARRQRGFNKYRALAEDPNASKLAAYFSIWSIADRTL